MTNLELSNHAGFMDEFMAAMFLPHTDASAFPGVHKRLRAQKGGGLKTMSFTIAVSGKGGTGKTTFAGMIIRYLLEKTGVPFWPSMRTPMRI